MSSGSAETQIPENPKGIGTIVMLFAIWILVAILASASLGYVTVTHLNDLDQRSQRHLAATALQLEQERIATLASEYAWWDEAIERLFPAADPSWIEANIGGHVQSNRAVDLTVVVSRSGAIHVGYRDGKFADINPDFLRDPDIQTLILEARRSPMEPVRAARGFALFDGKPYVFGVSAFSPEKPPEGTPPDLERAVLIYGREIDGDFLRIQAKNFALQDLRPTTASEPNLQPILSPNGTPIAGLIWEVHASGSDLIRRLIVPAIVVLLVLGGLGWYFMYSVRDMSRALAHAAEITSLRNEQLRQSESAAVRSQTLAEQASQEKDQALVELRQRNEELLRTRHEAMQASQAKTMFLASMSHELRTPLNAIIGFSEILRDQRFGALGSDRYVDYADTIRTSGTHLLALINDVLDISKIEAGKMTIEPEQITLKDLIAGTLRLFQEQAHVG